MGLTHPTIGENGGSLKDGKPRGRTCPACGHHFIPWRVLIPWWTTDCPKCRTRLGRTRDSQAFLIALGVLGLSAFAGVFAPPVSYARMIAGLVLLTLIDVYTLRLAPYDRTKSGTRATTIVLIVVWGFLIVTWCLLRFVVVVRP